MRSLSARPALRQLSTVPDFLLTAPASSVSELPNGVGVAAQPSSGPLATVGVFVGSGSRFETPAMSGVSHLMPPSGRENEVIEILEDMLEFSGGFLVCVGVGKRMDGSRSKANLIFRYIPHWF